MNPSVYLVQEQTVGERFISALSLFKCLESGDVVKMLFYQTMRSVIRIKLLFKLLKP